MSTERICKGCGVTIWQEIDKDSLGASALVWASSEGWICEETDQEHEPDGPDSVYQSDLDAITEGVFPEAVRDDDALFSALVDHLEGLGHGRTRIERDLREWVEENAEESNPMDPEEALTYAILAINTDQAPDATSGNDLLYLELNAERALHMLARLREYVIAQGEDFPSWVTDPEPEPSSAVETENVAERLEYLRSQIQAECISYAEIAELQGLADHIQPGDVELLEWAGVPEGGWVDCPQCTYRAIDADDFAEHIRLNPATHPTVREV